MIAIYKLYFRGIYASRYKNKGEIAVSLEVKNFINFVYKAFR